VTTPSAGSKPDRTRLVVGIGSLDRGDDAVGAAVVDLVADELEERGVRDVKVVAHEDPSDLPELMTGFHGVVIVDAIRTGAPAGRVAVHAVSPEGPGLPALIESGVAGTHGLGLAHALELARSLDRLPPLVCVVGIEAESFNLGAGLSPAVAGAVEHAVTAVVACLEEM
jgi:hydrogenase maturation protease